MKFARHKVLAVAVAECAGGVIHGAGQHAREGQRGVVHGTRAGAQLQILLAHHAFAGHQVRIGAPQAVGLVCAVEVDHEMMRGGSFHHAVIEAHHPLVVAVHKVDLDAGDAPLLEERKGLVHVFVDRGPVRPEPELDVLLFRVAQQLRHVDLRGHLA